MALKMEVVLSSKTLLGIVMYRMSLCCSQQDCNTNTYHCEKLKFHRILKDCISRTKISWQRIYNTQIASGCSNLNKTLSFIVTAQFILLKNV
jgi:hypothetical protein